MLKRKMYDTLLAWKIAIRKNVFGSRGQDRSEKLILLESSEKKNMTVLWKLTSTNKRA